MFLWWFKYVFQYNDWFLLQSWKVALFVVVYIGQFVRSNQLLRDCPCGTYIKYKTRIKKNKRFLLIFTYFQLKRDLCMTSSNCKLHDSRTGGKAAKSRKEFM
ncbi:hypothetical protein ACFFRR_001065 [Megaselia abdita]